MALDSKGYEVFPFVPFLYQGQYYNFETKLAYNRFRYYSPETGTYISQDPIGLEGGNPTLYGYVKDSNWWVDVFGLDCDVDKTRKLAQNIEEANVIFKCDIFAKKLKAKMKRAKISGELIEIKTSSNEGVKGNIWSNEANAPISQNGMHQGIKVEDTVFDNISPEGIEYDKWKNSLEFMPGVTHTETKTEF